MVSKPTIKWIGALRHSSRDGHKPVSICCHIVSGTLSSMDSWFNDSRVQASAHFGVGLQGQIHQYVDTERMSWANGVVETGATWPLLKKYPGINPNKISISIEFEGSHPNSDAGKFWAPNEAQIMAGAHLIAYLAFTYGIPLTRETVFGHYEVSPQSRPYCPGPQFPFDRIIAEAKKIALKEVVTAMFTDMNGHWAKEVVEKVAQRKTPQGSPVLSGIKQDDGTFKFFPDAPLTRAQAAVLVDRLLAIIDAK